MPDAWLSLQGPRCSDPHVCVWLALYYLWVGDAFADKSHIFQLRIIVTFLESEIWTTGDSMQRVKIISKFIFLFQDNSYSGVKVFKFFTWLSLKDDA